MIGFQIVSIVADAHGEGHDAYHPVDRNGTYASQTEESKPYVERLVEKRLPRYSKNSKVIRLLITLFLVMV